MKRIALALCLLGAPAFAQQPPRAPTATELQGMGQALLAQVEAMRNLHMQAEAKAATLAEENAALKKQIEELKRSPEKKD